MITSLVISISVLFLLLSGIFVLVISFPVIDSLVRSIFRGEVAVSIFEMFILLFTFAVVIFGGIGLLVGVL